MHIATSSDLSSQHIMNFPLVLGGAGEEGSELGMLNGHLWNRVMYLWVTSERKKDKLSGRWGQQR